jgi:translation initiation factor IF-2
VIYRLTEDVEKALKGMLEPEYEDVLIGKAEVRAVFRIPKIGNIAGSYVRDGELKRNATVKVMRGGQKLFEGKVSSLKHEKDDVRDVKQGFECGIGVDGFESFRAGDIIEFYVKQQKEVD